MNDENGNNVKVMKDFWNKRLNPISAKPAAESKTPYFTCIIPPSQGTVTVQIDNNITDGWEDMRDDITTSNDKTKLKWTKNGAGKDTDLAIIKYIIDNFYTIQPLRLDAELQNNLRAQWFRDHETQIHTYNNVGNAKNVDIQLRLNETKTKLCILIAIPEKFRGEPNNKNLLNTISNALNSIDDDEFFFVYNVITTSGSGDGYGGRRGRKQQITRKHKTRGKHSTRRRRHSRRRCRGSKKIKQKRSRRRQRRTRRNK